jgi:predicted alpha-1,2-mannosidase
MRNLLLIFTSLLLTSSFAQYQNDPARNLVNPFVGTGGHGHTFPGACVPNGLVQLSPDTRPDPVEWDGCGGYHYSDEFIYGFSHTHLSGTGVSDLADVLIMPMNAPYSIEPDKYRSKFSHSTESAHAGYYRVHLDDENVDVELSATQRAGIHRYTFHETTKPWIILDLDHRDLVTKADIKTKDSLEIYGERSSSSWATNQRLFYCVQSNRLIVEDTIIGNKAAFRFDLERASQSDGDHSRNQLILKVGISAVSEEGARNNLITEIPGWNFDEVEKSAVGSWNEKLNKIQVHGGTAEQRRIFYTALYHSYVAPYIFNDADGQYRGMDGQVHHADHDVYTVFSLWDTFRALHPLMTMLEPDMTSDWIKTFLLHFQQGGRLPVWELWGNETDCMIGYHSVSVIADAYLKGVRGFDAELALNAMVASANRDQAGLNAYRTKGFISSEDEAESVSKTLEYAYDDACISAMASILGKDEIAGEFYVRSLNWRNIFDPETKFFRPRKNGGFITPFDPFEVNFHMTEANSWQYRFFAPHAFDELIRIFQGKDSTLYALNQMFEVSEKTTGREQADITGLIGQYAHGNEPSHHMAFMYHLLGDTTKGDFVVRKILNELYQDTPEGLSGNEDCGQMSAWYVMSSIGQYYTSPGCGSPLYFSSIFDSVNVFSELAAIQNTNGFAVNNNTRGKSPRPVLAADIPVAPVIHAPERHFQDSMKILVTGNGSCTVSDSEGQRPCPMNQTFEITLSSLVEVNWSDRYLPVTASFNKVDRTTAINIESLYANQYSAGGDNALIDGIRGGSDFRTGDWQGYQGQDVSMVIDLGELVKLDSIHIGVLQDLKSWIWYPQEIQVMTSVNKKKWFTTSIKNTVPRSLAGAMKMDMSADLEGRKTRYIRIHAKNAGPCPAWHLGAGGESWIFMDEIRFKNR